MSPCPASPGQPTNTIQLLAPDGAPDTDTLTNDPTPAFAITGDGGNATYGAAVDGQGLGQWKTCSISTGAVGVQAASYGDGPHTFTASELSPGFGPLAPFSFTIDTVPTGPPTLRLDAVTNSRIFVSGTAPTGAMSVQVFVNGTFKAGSGVMAGAWAASTLTLAAGTYTVTAKTVDAAGNRSAASAPVTAVVP